MQAATSFTFDFQTLDRRVTQRQCFLCSSLVLAGDHLAVGLLLGVEVGAGVFVLDAVLVGVGLGRLVVVGLGGEEWKGEGFFSHSGAKTI